MRALRILSEEHQALREVLDALELVLDAQQHDDHLEPELALEALEWCERFADGLHQDREELGLLPRLRLRAPERAAEVLRGLTSWHALEREHLERMRAQIEGACYGDPWSRDVFTAAARDYIALQRRHSAFEDACILPLARELLGPEDDELMLAEYARLEQRHLRPGEDLVVEPGTVLRRSRP